MARLFSSHPAEEVLKEQGAISKRSVQRQAVIGCIGCRWLKAEAAGSEQQFYGYELMKCTGLPSGSLYPILNQLVEAGVMTAEREQADAVQAGRPLRTYYAPGATEIGEAFRQNLEVPEVCPLEADS
ncbi:MAG TPA: PadR family transcriptional regulator [Candidatus Dormibacteraeota bacterium]|nr:PadR family transcriptional regulator [Candidatus Dormibacteraeota bacterium]